MQFNRVKGVHDIYAPEIYLYQKIEEVARSVFSLYGFKEIIIPVIEFTELFQRGIGSTTDIVEKEMYTFMDKGGRSITLRPEGTAGVVRAYIENHLYNMPPPQKFFYSGPMFRYERPQAGRYREFRQIGVEAFGVSHPIMDAEIMLVLSNILRRLDFHDLIFEINSLGCERCRPVYKDVLLDFFRERIKRFCSDCQKRFIHNPLRLLDCKVPQCINERSDAPIITDFICNDCKVPQCINERSDAPIITDFICNDCKEHFERLKELLKRGGISFTHNPFLVRGLDYYTRTIFEVKSESLGAQNAIAAGGRYDNLVRELGGPPTPATGFAIGVERLMSLIKNNKEYTSPVPDVFIAFLGEEAELEALRLSENLRDAGLYVELGIPGKSLKSQLRTADKLNAEIVIMIGEDELRSSTYKWKNLKNGKEGTTGREDILSLFNEKERFTVC